MQQIEKELRLNQLRLIVIVSTLIFAFMLIYTIYWTIDYNKEYGFFEKKEAVVIEHQEIDDKTYDLLSYIVDDNEFRITTEYESKNDIGDKVTIYYDENYPLGVVYSLDSRRFVLPILSSIFGVANISLIVLYFLIRKSVLSKPIQKEIVEVFGSDDATSEEFENTKPKTTIKVESSKSKKVSSKTTNKTITSAKKQSINKKWK